MKVNAQINKLASAIRVAALVGVCVATVPARALDWDVGEWLINLDTTLGAAAQWRTESRDKGLAADLNSNDGNNNFDPGLVSARGNILLDFGGEYRDFSFFVRADAVYDQVYHGNDTDMSLSGYETYNNGTVVGGNVKRGEFPRDTIAEHGRRTRLLDAFISYNFGLGDQSGAVRLGRQVISWGESTLYPGINAMQNPIDAVAALSPGAEVKELFLPTNAINLMWDFTDSFGVEVYYKDDWKRSTLPGVGSYFSTNDFTGPGAERISLGPLGAGDVIRAQKPGDSDGQWGLAARYMTEQGSNFDAYYTESHANIPGAKVIIDLATGEHFAQEIYADNVHLWGASFSGNLGEAQVYVDGVYSDNMPFVDASFQNLGYWQRSDVVRGHYWQVAGGLTDIYTAFPRLSEQIVVLAEILYQGNNLGGSELIYPPLSLDFQEPLEAVKATDNAWGYQFRVIMKYFSVLPGLDLDVPITFKHDVDGYGNPIALSNGLKEDQKSASIGVDGFYLTNWQFSAKYAWYFGNDIPEDLVISDRDNVSISMKYVF